MDGWKIGTGQQRKKKNDKINSYGKKWKESSRIKKETDGDGESKGPETASS